MWLAPQRTGFGMCGAVPTPLQVNANKNRSKASISSSETADDYDVGVTVLICDGACPLLLSKTYGGSFDLRVACWPLVGAGDRLQRMACTGLSRCAAVLVSSQLPAQFLEVLTYKRCMPAGAAPGLTKVLIGVGATVVAAVCALLLCVWRRRVVRRRKQAPRSLEAAGSSNGFTVREAAVELAALRPFSGSLLLQVRAEQSTSALHERL